MKIMNVTIHQFVDDNKNTKLVYVDSSLINVNEITTLTKRAFRAKK